MAARRMLAFVLVLLILGMGAAALTPRELREGGDDPPATSTTATPTPTTSATTTPGAPPPAAGGTTAPTDERGVRTVAADPGDPPLIKARRGELLELGVAVEEPTALTLEGYNQVKEADPTSPARFSLYLYLEGRFGIRPAGGGPPVAELQVR